MRKFKALIAGATVVATSLGLSFSSGQMPLAAADHFDPPARTDALTTSTPDIGADMADLYLFYTADAVVISMDFGGPSATTLPAFYDRDVLFKLFVSNAGALTDPEFTITFKFGKDTTKPNAFGVRVTGLPGNPGPIDLPVEMVHTLNGGLKLHVGLIDDPFNFDAGGLRETRQTQVLSIRNDRNRFQGLNSTAFTLEIPYALIRNGDNKIGAWATSARVRSGL